MSRRGKPKTHPKPPGDENKAPEFIGKRLDNRPVSWHVQPPSKTAICHVDYGLGDSAVLCVVPIQVSIKHEETDKLVPITSRKLRGKSIAEYLNRRALDKSITFHLAQKTIKAGNSEKASPIDQLILFGSDKADLLMVSKEAYELNTVMMIKKPDGGKIETPIHCSLNATGLKELAATDDDNTEYWKKVQIILRKSTRIATSSFLNKGAVSCTSLGSFLGDAGTKSNDSKSTVKEAPILNSLFRTTLKLDPNNRRIRAEIDLVSGVRGGTKLSAIMQRCLAVANGMSHENGAITNSPPGKINVLSDITTSANNAAARGSGPGPGNTTQNDSNGFPASNVIDLKRAGEVPDFWKDNVRYSVAKYLKVYYGLKQPSNLLNMPLANIGKDSWVPLHLLETVGSNTEIQQIPLGGQMTTSFMGKLVNESVEAHTENAKKLVTNLMDKMRNSHTQLARILSDEIVACESVYHSSVPVTNISRAQIKPSQTGTGVKYGIIYVQPKGLYDDNSKKLANSVLELLNSHAGLENDKKIVNIDRSFEQPVAIVPDIKPLLLPASEQYPGVKAMYVNVPDTIIAIVDERGRSKQEIRFIRSELQKFGNRKVGAVVQCISRKDLEIKNGSPSHIPIGALQRINAMHGNTNFIIKDPPKFPNANLMVVGAHISHPGSGAASSCPSVTSIVGSVDKDLMHYPGSARLQPTLKNTSWRKDKQNSKLKYEVESQIRDLESMIIERIEAWVNKQGKVKAPHVVFYRHSNQSCDGTIIEDEMQDIQKACDQFTDWEHGKLTFSYVLVNKNALANSPYTSKDHADQHAKQKFNVTEGESNGAGTKYEYFVQKATEDNAVLSVEQHRLLTRHLNANYQLGKNDNIAIALPVHFAQKLAKRMYDYFRFAVTNQYDTVSSVLRRLQHPDHEGAENDKEMTELMNEYLLHYGAACAASAASEAPVRKNPWLENLDDKMFYL